MLTDQPAASTSADPPAPPGMSNDVKLSLIVGGAFVLCGLLCCGGMEWLLYDGFQRKPAFAARMKMEVGQLSIALEHYRDQFGEYPPDGTDPTGNDILRHLRKVFPRYSGGLPQGVKLDPTTALPFWLGGMTDAQGNHIGFSTNPANPFDNSTSRIPEFYDFDPRQLSGGAYYPLNGLIPASGAPYVYYAARNGHYTAGGDTLPKPYMDTRSGTWVNPQTFQILSPGLDGVFGSGNHYPAGKDYDPANYDDITNFTQKLTLGDDVPE